jgi:acetolactate synthase I/II/III large subunit
MVKVSDLVAEFLKENEIKTIFGIIGSANSHIFNSIDELGYTKIINTHHEQAAVMAMGAHYRASGKMSAVIVTAGAGATNAITGVVSNWADSIPGIIISGNESTEHIKEHSKLRMYGTQGLNITKMVKDVTKYSHCVMHENTIQNQLESCLLLSQIGRKGPTWLDIPFNIQSKMVEKRPWAINNNLLNPTSLPDNTNKIIKAINEAERPLVLGGNGVRLSNSKDKFNEFINKTNLPTTLTWSGIDLMSDDNPNYFGRFGLYGQRSANYIVQNCDLLVVLGSRLALPQTGYDWDEFIREGKIICVDIDELQAPKEHIDLHIKSDVSIVLDQLLDNVYDIEPIDESWLNYCNRKNDIRLIDYDIHSNNGYINSYQFIDRLSDYLKDDHIIVTDMGTALLSGHQAIKLKENQQMFTSLGLGEMGYGIAGAVGASAACPDKDVLCLNCDGGIMMNLQELHTVIENGLNVKVIIFNNDGYLMIKHTQKMLFDGNYVSVDGDTGIGLPNFSKLLPALGYEYFELKEWEEVNKTITQFLKHPTHSVLEVFMDPNQGFLPKVKGVPREDGSILAPPIEDMSPLVSLDKLKGEMVVEISKKSKEIKR